ncbi:hypothetical protein GCM10020331_076770 [Ectobacillus funiculus]
MKERGASFHELLPYHHVPPEGHVMEQLLSEMLGGEIDAVNFTSTPQARFLMEFARNKGVEQQVLDAFASNIVAVAVGKGNSCGFTGSRN